MAGTTGSRCERELTCSDYGATVVIASPEDLEDLGARGCRTLPSSLEIRNLNNPSPALVEAALGPVVNIEGSLLVTGCTGLDLSPLVAGLATLASAATSSRLQQGVYSALVTDNVNIGLTAAQVRVLVAASAGQGVVRVADNTGFCPTASDLASSDGWWRFPAVVQLAFVTSQCAPTPCSMYTDPSNTDSCVSSCADPGVCPTPCRGRIVSTASDISPFLPATNGDQPALCQLMVGSLVLNKMTAAAVNLLHDAFASLTTIASGGLVVTANEHLVVLHDFAALEHADFVLISDNVNLTDARLPNLVTGINVTVDNNRHLCDSAGPYGSEACALASVSLGLDVAGGNLSGIDNTTLNAALQQAFADSNSSATFSTALSVSAELTNVDEADEDNGEQSGANRRRRTTGDTDWTLLFSILADVNDIEAITNALRHILTTNALLTTLNAVASQDIARLSKNNLAVGLEVARYDSGVIVSLDTSSDRRLTVEWNNGNSTDTVLAYTLAFRLAPTVDMYESLSKLFSARLDTLGVSQDAQQDRIAALYDQAAEWTSLPLPPSVQELDLNVCDQGQRSSLTAPCLRPGRPYQIRILRHTAQRASASAIHVFQPSIRAVTLANVAATTAGNNAIEVTWDASNATELGLGQIEVVLQYHVRGNALSLASAGGGSSAFVNELLPMPALTRLRVNASASRHLIQGCFYDIAAANTHCLAPFTIYSVLLRPVVDAKDHTVVAIPTTAYVATAPALPASPPQSVTLSSAASSALNLLVTAPAWPNGEIVGFRVRVVGPAAFGDAAEDFVTSSLFVPASRNGLAQASQPAAPFVVPVENLPPYSHFAVEVAAVNTVGDGNYSAAANFSTAEAIASTMLPPTVQALSGGQFAVSWTAPAVIPGILLGYELISNYNVQSDSGDVLYNGTATSVTVGSVGTGLRVRAITGAGASPWSPTTSTSTTSSGSSGLGGTSMVGLAAAVGVCVLALVVVGVTVLRKRSTKANYLRKEADDWEIPYKNIRLGKKLGEGQFGVVYKAVAEGLRDFNGSTQVAVKMCEGPYVTTKDKEDFVAEGELMKELTYPPHPNVVRLLGVCSTAEPLCMVIEYMELGDMKSLLRESRPTMDSPGQISLDDRLRLAADVARGMHFLSATGFVHRDLAARNVLVDGNLVAKISDFGLSRALQNSDYYRKSGQALLPVRWMAPESLAQGKFSTDSDVWSFGVMLWEVVTFAALPYPGRSNKTVVDDVMKVGLEGGGGGMVCRDLHTLKSPSPPYTTLCF